MDTPLTRIPRPTSPYPKHTGGSRDGEFPCAVCGRNLRMSRARKMLLLTDGAATVVPPGETYEEEQPVGPECLRAFPHLKPYTVEVSWR
jgi:hypothetical protein